MPRPEKANVVRWATSEMVSAMVKEGLEAVFTDVDVSAILDEAIVVAVIVSDDVELQFHPKTSRVAKRMKILSSNFFPDMTHLLF